MLNLAWIAMSSPWFLFSTFHDLISKIFFPSRFDRSNKCIFTSFYGLLETLNFISFSVFPSLSLTPYKATFVCRNNRQVFECHDCMHNVIYSWCISKRKIIVYLSKKKKKKTRHHESPKDGAVSLTISYISSSSCLSFLRSPFLSFKSNLSASTALSKYLITFRALMRLIPIENPFKKWRKIRLRQ